MAEPEPLKWKDRSEALSAIKQAIPDWEENRTSTSETVYQVVKTSVSSNTFRGFPMEASPSSIFRAWAFQFLETNDLAQIESRSHFDASHRRYVDRLRRCWECAAGTALHYGGAVKLVDLLLLYACKHFHCLGNRLQLMHYIHVPLDRFVLLAIRDCGTRVEIPLEPSMGSIKTEHDYLKIQNFLRELADEAACEPVVIDYLAWAQQHR